MMSETEEEVVLTIMSSQKCARCKACKDFGVEFIADRTFNSDFFRTVISGGRVKVHEIIMNGTSVFLDDVVEYASYTVGPAIDDNTPGHVNVKRYIANAAGRCVRQMYVYKDIHFDDTTEDKSKSAQIEAELELELDDEEVKDKDKGKGKDKDEDKGKDEGKLNNLPDLPPRADTDHPIDSKTLGMSFTSYVQKVVPLRLYNFIHLYPGFIITHAEEWSIALRRGALFRAHALGTVHTPLGDVWAVKPDRELADKTYPIDPVPVLADYLEHPSKLYVIPADLPIKSKSSEEKPTNYTTKNTIFGAIRGNDQDIPFSNGLEYRYVPHDFVTIYYVKENVGRNITKG